MCAYSNLDGTSPINPASTGVWGIRKKQKIADRDRKKDKEDQKDKEKKGQKELQETLSNNTHGVDNHPEEQAVYSSTGKKKPTIRKVDVTI